MSFFFLFLSLISRILPDIMMNKTYKLNDLTEEIFGHLCNVALHKCSDKSEKKRAGCGGRAMRKRVLIKNFVSDLFKMPKKPTSPREQDMASSSDEEYDDYDMSEVAFFEEDIDEFRLEDLTNNYDHHHHQMMHNDIWLHQPYPVNELSGGFGSMSTVSYNPFDMSPPSYSSGYGSFDMYGGGSSMSESATEGDLPMASDPLASISGCVREPSRYDAYTSANPGGPATYFPGDDYFLANRASVEPVFTSTSPEPLHDTHELTDLDVATGECHANKKKRRSTELFDDFNVAFQKRIKI
ncbi:hypothetical protein L5515_000029 [Caenorhabditis briggsae]|uniref:Uncharacterized protein n=1 Tax=Caenorhabditis briggsae TaxID=6238 RepID=A0AAE9E0G0_CAEBR|nr:hypothetical protein L5515_000029 [Caenorhabditis briggsae]